MLYLGKLHIQAWAGFSPTELRAKSCVSISTDLDTDDYDIELEESSIQFSLNDLDLDYNIPMNYTKRNDFTANQYFQTMQTKTDYNTPANSTKSYKPVKTRASTPYKAYRKSKLWKVRDQ